MSLLDLGRYPVDAHLGDIAQALAEHPTLLIKAEAGAGKTTRIPTYLLGETQGEILVLEPRRLAAKLTAERCASFLKEKIGQRVGYRIRQDRKTSKETRLTFLTEGLFIRMLRSDPTLQGVGLVILDEFHERNLHTDVALSLLLKLQAKERPDLKLIIMSATLETKDLEGYLSNSKTFDLPGRTFPVDEEYLDERTSIAQAVDLAMADPRCPRNILVFLPGMGEIKREQAALSHRKDALILPLASQVSQADQRLVFQPSKKRKVILSTNVAETSVTVPDITGVIDQGVARIPGVAPWSGMPTLPIKRISQASAIQRAGRAGRTQEGVVYRLYSRDDYLRREAFTPPDIQRLDLSQTVLDLMSMGFSMEELPWFQAPDPGRLEVAFELLKNLGALDAQENLTSLGRSMSELPLHPRLSALIVRGRELGMEEDATLAASLISEGFILRRNFTPHETETLKCDVAFQMEHLKNPDASTPHITDAPRSKRVLSLYKQLCPKPLPKTTTEDLSPILMAGFADRVAKKLKGKGGKKGKAKPNYHFCLGRGGILSDQSLLAQPAPDLILAIEALETPGRDAKKGTMIRMGSQISLDLALDSTSPLRTTQREGTLEKECFGKLTLKERNIQEELGDLPLIDQLKACWPAPFESDQDLRTYHRKIQLLDQAGIPHQCPQFEGEMLELLHHSLADQSPDLKTLAQRSLWDHLMDQLGWESQEALRVETPNEVKLSNGKSFRVHYDEEPRIEGLVQDFYGVKEKPSIIQGRIPLKIVLLAPNRRPAQITMDLPGFWTGSYAEVSKELRRRYPKHHWAEDPASAPPLLLKKHLN